MASDSRGQGAAGLLLLVPALLCQHCGSSQSHANATGGNGGQSNGGSANAGQPSTSFGGAVTSIPGGPGCGLGDLAAFCDAFDAPAKDRGRAGDLDRTRWSAARQRPQAPTANGLTIGIVSTALPGCRADIVNKVFPDQDTAICDPNTGIRSNHLLVASAAQNYGQNSYRIRQPFDFAGRTGKIVFDAEAYMSALLGWVSVELTEDPAPAPSFAVGPSGTANDEGSAVPRNAIEVQFANDCAGAGEPPLVGMRMLLTVADYVQTSLKPDSPVCLKAMKGSLNHFEITVSQNRVEIFGSSFSADGATFEQPTLLFSSAVDLPFTRGYVHITTHNHATRKYSPNNAMDAWLARWDNVGFDGPAITDFREYEIPDSLVPATSTDFGESEMNIGYLVADAADAPHDVLHFTGVDPQGMSKARLALSMWFLQSSSNASYGLKFRLNGGTWHDRPLTPAESGQLSDSHSQGAIELMVDVPTSELVSGDNTLEFLTTNVPHNYPPAVSNIDLVLAK